MSAVHLALTYASAMFLVAIIPGACMLLALSTSITHGKQAALVMASGELLGLAVMVSLSLLGLGLFVASFEGGFPVLEVVSWIYLAYIGVSLMSCDLSDRPAIAAGSCVYRESFVRGLLVIVTNPKGWLFLMLFLPSFVDTTLSFELNFFILLTVTLICEGICLWLYICVGQRLEGCIKKYRLTTVSGLILVGFAVYWVADKFLR